MKSSSGLKPAVSDDRKAWLRVAGIDSIISECISDLQEQFDLSDNQIAKEFREKASQLAPRKKIVVVKVTKEMIEKIIKNEEVKQGAMGNSSQD